METLLHVEPLTRRLDTPLVVGDSDYVFYGSQCTADDENVGHASANICLGSPLVSERTDNKSCQVPLVKTIGKIPNYHLKGEVVTETIHYLDGQTLIPIRMKLRSGFGEGLCISHLPSLNLTRRRLTGTQCKRLIDPRSEIVESLINNGGRTSTRIRPWVRDWMQDDLLPRLRGISHSVNALSVEPTERIIDNCISELDDLPSEMNLQNAQQIWQSLVPELSHIPAVYHLTDPICLPLAGVRQQIIPNHYDFRSWGDLDLSSATNIAYSPKGMETYAEWFDDIPLTDFNVDLVCGMKGETLFYHCHVAVNRFDALKAYAVFGDAHGVFLHEELDADFLSQLLEKFVLHHPCLDREIVDWISYENVKIKFIKTMREEAAILLYRADDNGNGAPVAGVKFDLGLQFLAPMSVMEEAI